MAERGEGRSFGQPDLCSFCLRPYRTSDLPAMARLFRETICSVNARDYAPDQVRVWSARWKSILGRDGDFRATHTVVAACGSDDPSDGLVGFGNIDHAGYLDLLYVHRDWQGHGIATALCDELERFAREAGACEATTHASITARPFFEARGYTVTCAQTVELEGVELANFAMAKPL